MGRGKAEQPKLIAQKLRQIRLSLGMTQDEMARAIERQGVKIYRAYVGLYEISERVPTVLVIMAYARIANISMETLCDDKMELPEGLICGVKQL
ncbi:MAG: helix-turn-helix transcriptional regulator [Pyrinomonadaceae bacterium]